MRLFSWFKGKPNNVNHVFDEEDRNLSLEKRRLKQQLEQQKYEIERLKLEQQSLQLQDQIESYKADLGYYDEEEDNESPTDKMISVLLANMLAKNQAVNTHHPTNSTAETSTSQLDFSDEQLKEMWDNIPANYKAMAKLMSDEQLVSFIRNKYNNISSNSLHKAIDIVRGRA